MTDYPRPLSLSALQKRFGSFHWRAIDDSAILILNNWQQSVATRVYIPQLAGIPSYGGVCKGWIDCHKDAAPHFLLFFDAVEKAGHKKDILFYGGCWVPRRARGSRALSHHSWGIAMDLNPNENPFKSKGAGPRQRGHMGRLGVIAEKCGLAWGGRWSGRPDPMHIEVCCGLPRGESEVFKEAKLVINNEWEKPVPLMIREGRTYAYASYLNAALDLPPPIEDAPVRAAEWLAARNYSVKWDNDQKKLYANKLGG